MWHLKALKEVNGTLAFVFQHYSWVTEWEVTKRGVEANRELGRCVWSAVDAVEMEVINGWLSYHCLNRVS